MASRRSNDKRSDKVVRREAPEHKPSSPIRKRYRSPQPQKASNKTQASHTPSSTSLEDNPSSSSSRSTNISTTTLHSKSTTTTLETSTTTTTISTTPTTSTMPALKALSKPKARPAFLAKLRYISQPLRPFISVTTGQAHPYFPNTLLAYHLLTSAQLDALAAYYHQFIPSAPQTNFYPVKIPSWVDRAGRPLLDVPVATKRMLFGQFIGLVSSEERLEEQQAMLLDMEAEWQETLARARRDDEDAEVLRKIGGRF